MIFRDKQHGTNRGVNVLEERICGIIILRTELQTVEINGVNLPK
jgi:hypothetical protein